MDGPDGPKENVYVILFWDILIYSSGLQISNVFFFIFYSTVFMSYNLRFDDSKIYIYVWPVYFDFFYMKLKYCFKYNINK